jgi:hypothetical protein
VCQERRDFVEKEVLELKWTLAQRAERFVDMSSTIEEKNSFLAQELENAELQSLIDKVKEEVETYNVSMLRLTQ